LLFKKWVKGLRPLVKGLRPLQECLRPLQERLRTLHACSVVLVMLIWIKFDRMFEMRNWQKNLFGIGLGILLIFLLELGLWIFKFHRPVCEFDPYLTFKESVPVLIENEYTGEKWLSLNPRLRDYFNPIAFPKSKAIGVRRIFVLGESSTLGFPFLEHGSYAWFLKLGLDELEPGHRYQVVNFGAKGFASYRILRVFKEVLNYEPDLIVVMMGQNEFLEKREYRRSARFIRIQERLSGLKLYCLLKVMFLKLQPAREQGLIGTDVKWEKMSTDSETRAKIIEHFRFNVKEMVRLADEKKVDLLFLTSASNLKDFAPYHSVHRAGMTDAEMKTWNKRFDDAKMLIQEKRCGEAIPVLQEIIKADEVYAEAWYLLGQCFYEEGKFEEAKGAFVKALVNDSWQVRALPEFNESIRELVRGKAGVVDIEKVFEEQSLGGIPGDNLFYDHCHPKIKAQALIAKQILQRLNRDQWLILPENWELMYDDIVSSYEASLGPGFWTRVYYNLAIETGVNMGLKELGRKYLDEGLKIAPEDAMLRRAERKLK